MSNFFEGQQLDPKFIVEQFMNLFKTLGSHGQAQGNGIVSGKFDKPDVEAALRKKGVSEADIAAFWGIKGRTIRIPKVVLEASVPDLLSDAAVARVMKNFKTWDPSWTPPPAISPPTREERKTDLEEPEESDPVLKVDPLAAMAEDALKGFVEEAEAKINARTRRDTEIAAKEAAEAATQDEIERAMHESYVTGKTERLFRTLKDRFNFHKTSKIPTGLVKEYLTALDPDAEEAAIAAHITDLENVKVREDKAAADGKIKKDLDEEDIRKKAFALLQRSTVLRKKLFKQAQGALSGTPTTNKESLEQFKVHPKNKETAASIAKVKKVKKPRKGKGNKPTENISILV